jgi:hypothetical protein
VEQGATACGAKRIPAEVLEESIIAAVMEFYADPGYAH